MNKKKRQKLWQEASDLAKECERLINKMEKDVIYMGQKQWGWLRESRKQNNNQK